MASKYIIVGIVGQESYYVPDGLEIPKCETDEALWDFIYENNLDAEIDYESISNTGIISIEEGPLGINVTNKYLCTE